MTGRNKRGGPAGRGLFAVVLAAPLLVFVAALGTRFGLWNYATGYERLAMQAGPGLAALGALAALVLLVMALRGRASAVLAVAALLVSGATVGGYAWQISQFRSAPLDDISTDLVEVPGFGVLNERRGPQGPLRVGGVASCPGAVPAMTQVAPEAAVWALQEAGFSLQGGVAVHRVAGTHRGFWFGTVHDAVIRIRPGRTDVRVTARDGRAHGGEACRLATRISEGLRTGG